MTVASESDAAKLLAAVLGSTTGLSNITAAVSGNSAAFGKFDNDPFGLGNGIVLSTGRAVDVVGSNDIEDRSTNFGINNGDKQFDKATLTITFDADSTVDKVFFSYVFGSEEFIEFAGGDVNDSFKTVGQWH